ncbi:ATP-dependent zinc metalloprotease FtsH [Anaeromyxobacter paludicola]|uniref:ATP-dependent zinc metalloprotease FtsH n=1 Tax=Anaeromyxobacter paludicola TaxID=2918171 RepID=A0ABM7X7N0_9BACT|nr:ATP-dependent zinc metalloprotease FtsH [Anaeromyxobacter paludicola]BDG07854.1 ATP-dependent zinc metalloprotease FtsH [Anaeromyxobacter paludicola]
MRQSYKTVLLWVVLILMFVAFYQFFAQHGREQKEFAWSDFSAQIEKDNVRDVVVKDNITYSGHLRDGSEFKTVGPIDPMATISDKLVKKGVKVIYDKPEQNSFWVTVLVQYLPLVFLFLLFFFFMRQLQSGGGKAMSFGKSKAKLMTEHHNKVTFADVAGIDESKDELEEIISFLKDPKKFTKLGGRIPKGVLLMGPPGTGKTLLARAVAGEAGVPFFSISGSDFVEMFVGVGASRVRDLFEQGKKNAPCIIFIDEIDAVGRHRGAGLGGGHDEREQTLNQLLVEMDGFESNEGVILIAATNRPDVLDPALLRPGRFDRRITVPRPDVNGRLGVLKVHTKKTPLESDVDLNQIARGTPGFSGADIENLVNEAALYAARRNKERLDLSDFEYAKDKVLMGTERKSMIISEKEKRTTAIHEAGHALVAKIIPGTDPVHKVTIIPRGRALGLTQQLPTEDRLNISQEYATNQIAILMGGRIAEEITFHQKTTGAGNDIEVATNLAHSMVCEWGMSEKMGPLALGKKEGEVFLGREMNQVATYSQQTAQDIDAEVRRIVTEQYERAKKILLDNGEVLNRIADALLEYETIDSADIDVLMAGGSINRPPPPKAQTPTAPATVDKAAARKPGILEGVAALPKAEPGKA